MLLKILKLRRLHNFYKVKNTSIWIEIGWIKPDFFLLNKINYYRISCHWWAGSESESDSEAWIQVTEENIQTGEAVFFTAFPGIGTEYSQSQALEMVPMPDDSKKFNTGTQLTDKILFTNFSRISFWIGILSIFLQPTDFFRPTNFG